MHNTASHAHPTSRIRKRKKHFLFVGIFFLQCDVQEKKKTLSCDQCSPREYPKHLQDTHTCKCQIFIALTRKILKSSLIKLCLITEDWGLKGNTIFLSAWFAHSDTQTKIIFDSACACSLQSNKEEFYKEIEPLCCKPN